LDWLRRNSFTSCGVNGVAIILIIYIEWFYRDAITISCTIMNSRNITIRNLWAWYSHIADYSRDIYYWIVDVCVGVSIGVSFSLISRTHMLGCTTANNPIKFGEIAWFNL
jgi:hypothetical protein